MVVGNSAGFALGSLKPSPDHESDTFHYRARSQAAAVSLDGPFDKIINYTRNVIIRTHGDYFSQTKAASGLNRSIGCVEILYGL